MWSDSNSAALLDARIYSVTLAVIIGFIYTFPILNVDRFVNRWIDSLFGRNKVKAIIAPITPTKIYPRSWWVEEKTFQLERRAIFSKTWLFVTHTSRFKKPGDYRTFEIAGFSFIVILGKDKTLRAFHNVCRHRAYAVTKKESGSSIVLGCRYHGWSYDTKGKLVKAPEFENVDGFDKNLNGLWELKVRVEEGLVFVNFDAGAESEGIDQTMSDLEPVPRNWDVEKMSLIAEWKIEGKFNWKIAEGIPFESGEESTLSLWSMLKGQFGFKEDWQAPSYSVQFIMLRSGRLLTIKVLPLSKNQTTIECNIYSKNMDKSLDNSLEIEKLKLTVATKITELETQQRKLTSGTTEFACVRLDEMQQLCEEHLNIEKKLGAEIHPAARKHTVTQDGKDDDDLCKELENEVQNKASLCGMKATNELEW